MKRQAFLILPLVLAGLVPDALAEPRPRAAAAAGAVIARKAGEEIRFIDISAWEVVDLKQDLLSGDVLRTNANGQLAILFSDRTQVRLGRNSSLLVRQVAGGRDAELELQSGTIWARAERGGPGVSVQTPAATAAIRGTDWTMTVEGDRTTLTVLEGKVELSNSLGRVELSRGEAAVASIGQAPRKIAIVESDDREQMLFYLPPREAFERMPPSALPVADMRRQADRIRAIPEAERSAEDRVLLAEVALSLEGRAKAKAALAAAQRYPLSRELRARVLLIEAVISATENRHAQAASLFQRAAPGLDKKRRAIALYGGYYARALADPDRVETLPPQGGGSDAAFLRAYAIGFLQDLPAAINVLKQAEAQFPDDPELPAYRAWLALLLNDRDQTQEAMSRSLALDPQEPTALEVRAHVRSGLQGDLDGALADLEAAVSVAPASSTAWNGIGNVQSARGAVREAEAAFLKAIDLDPQDPVSHANLAIFYLDNSRVEDARRHIDLALAADPAFDIALVARGRYHLQTGELDSALDDLLAGTVSNPAYAQGQVLLAAAHYERGDRLPAEQALDNAQRLDANDPVIYSFRAAAAIDDYDSVAAIRNAQEFVRRSRDQGGNFASLGANHLAGSALNSAFRLQGMNAWGEYYGDVVFNPLVATSYIDQSLRGSADPFANDETFGGDPINNAPNGEAFSSLLQGLMLDPHIISGRSRSANLLRRPFLESAIGGGFIRSDGETGYVGEGEIQGYTNLPIPMSLFGNLQWSKAPDRRDIGALSPLDSELEILGGNGYVTASPTLYDRVVLYANHGKNELERSFGVEANFAPFVDPTDLSVLPLPLNTEQEVHSRATNAGIGWSHTLGYRNVLSAALLYSGVRREDETYFEFDVFGLPLATAQTRSVFEEETYVAAVNHTIGDGDLTWRYGMEGGWVKARQSQSYQNLLVPPLDLVPSTFEEAGDTSTVGRVYVDLLQEVTNDLRLEYALFGSFIDGDSADKARLEPRAGLAWSPADGHWLRAAFSRSSLDLNTPTLSPIGVLGLQTNQVSLAATGYVDTYALRWDAEWTSDFFTAVEYQHQEMHDLRIAVPLTSIPFTTAEGQLDRASLTSNLLLGYGFGLSSTLALAQSQDEDPRSPISGEALPFLPKLAGQVAVTWVNQANVKATLAANYVGERQNEAGLELDDYWTLDASLTWEPLDQRLELSLAAYNLLDEEIELNAGVPGWGRSFRGVLKARF
ncbi:FecR domain-containing protein [Rhizobium sp. SSA_523]|uniref:FecR domain-containing protein n=1 Tax=Rhizobium sp. SSA_523 TaxID=2952477 RepID=UPI0020908B24|nr:FecR domain-containing protein [Rhizobium sp. SSA_523]MCO5731452.1 TonB-dependent receptor [Rhizobium sp. SSA_523]WKC22026.1 TonB-dependent receptor [Rhizobium sp. SSA_523]